MKVQVRELKELGRLACALERIPFPILHLNRDGGILAVQFDFFRGMPVLYYVREKEAKNYLGYRNSAGLEEAQLTDNTSNPAYLYAPIIFIEQLPRPYEAAWDARRRVKGFPMAKLRDLSSLIKVAAYKVLYEESPLPLFTFPNKDGQWIIGCFHRVEDYEAASLFYYTSIKAEPTAFLRHPVSGGEAPSFTQRIDEHGYLYVKVIHLAESHPLVEVP